MPQHFQLIRARQILSSSLPPLLSLPILSLAYLRALPSSSFLSLHSPHLSSSMCVWGEGERLSEEEYVLYNVDEEQHMKLHILLV